MWFANISKRISTWCTATSESCLSGTSPRTAPGEIPGMALRLCFLTTVANDWRRVKLGKVSFSPWFFASYFFKSRQGPTGLVRLIRAKIVDQKQVPVPNSALMAANIDGVEPESHVRASGANEEGFCQFVDVPEGRYSIVVKRTGYRDYKISDWLPVRGGETIDMPDIQNAFSLLTARKAARASWRVTSRDIVG